MIDIHTITTDIAERLSLITGELWNARLPAHGRDDPRIIVAERDQAEVEITHATSTHRHRRHATPPLRISVAGHRPAVEIAKEITRWLLTSYRAELHEARRRKATYDVARAYEEATAAELAVTSTPTRSTKAPFTTAALARI